MLVNPKLIFCSLGLIFSSENIFSRYCVYPSMKHLHNIYSREDLLRQRKAENFTRKTVSFYRYVIIEDPVVLRDRLYADWFEMGVMGRVYLAKEGINAQISVPEHQVGQFINYLDNTPYFAEMSMKWAVEDDPLSFLKLKMKVRNKIVADGLAEGSFDVTNVGKHLTAAQFNAALQEEGTIVVDMRNHYESEIGRFENALCPDVDTFREEIDYVTKALEDKKDAKILMYCTGGVRCEKASAHLKHHGFSDVSQLYGGIIEYARQVKEEKLNSMFKGKNFVFDERLGERITEDVIAHCHQCGTPCDTHTNCANDDCHLLFIQCPACAEKYAGCCSERCSEIILLPKDERLKIRGDMQTHYAQTQIFRSRIRPKLKMMK